MGTRAAKLLRELSRTSIGPGTPELPHPTRLALAQEDGHRERRDKFWATRIPEPVPDMCDTQSSFDPYYDSVR